MHIDSKPSQFTEDAYKVLGDHARRYIDLMRVENYSSTSTSRHRRCLTQLDRLMSQKQLVWEDLTEATAVALICSAGDLEKLSISPAFIIRRFVSFLVDQGYLNANEPLPTTGPRAELQRDYEAFLRQHRGLAKSTIFSSLYWADRFLTFRFGNEIGDLSEITPDDIVRFLQDLIVNHHSPLPERRPPTHLRNFFRYLFQVGKTPVYLASGVANIRRSSAGRMRRYLDPDQVEALLKAVRPSSPYKMRWRNFAMVLLQARLGLRAPEVIAMQIDDINWRVGEIIIRGKGGRHDRLPIPRDVGEAIAKYLRLERPRVTCRSLFIMGKAPYQPFKNGQVLLKILNNAFAMSGLKQPAPFIGSHVLRHSLASRLAQQGASLGEVGDLLRHRTQATTLIYAKLDIDSLRSIAQSWPVAGAAK